MAAGKPVNWITRAPAENAPPSSKLPVRGPVLNTRVPIVDPRIIGTPLKCSPFTVDTAVTPPNPDAAITPWLSKPIVSAKAHVALIARNNAHTTTADFIEELLRSNCIFRGVRPIHHGAESAY